MEASVQRSSRVGSNEQNSSREALSEDLAPAQDSVAAEAACDREKLEIRESGKSDSRTSIAAVDTS
ncbi:hypothetical protein ACFIOY_18275 [Bradyrhizobium sp. TZ2]